MFNVQKKNSSEKETKKVNEKPKQNTKGIKVEWKQTEKQKGQIGSKNQFEEDEIKKIVIETGRNS